MFNDSFFDRYGGVLEAFAKEASSEAYKYGATAVPYVCADARELGAWFMGFAEACRGAQ